MILIIIIIFIIIKMTLMIILTIIIFILIIIMILIIIWIIIISILMILIIIIIIIIILQEPYNISVIGIHTYAVCHCKDEYNVASFTAMYNPFKHMLSLPISLLNNMAICSLLLSQAK